MKIIMAGIDHTIAGLATREKFILTGTMEEMAYREILRDPRIRGAVLLCTCNRTEIYLSCRDGFDENPFRILCRALGQEFAPYEGVHKVRSGEALFWHLCRLACGTKSRIWGEDQILAQVKQALESARRNRAADSVLEVLFRNAITAAKQSKSLVRFTSAGRSVAGRTLTLLQEKHTAPARVLVIGNGEVGKMVAGTLAGAGYQVAMTVRSYRHGGPDIPDGVDRVPYSDRYREMGKCEVLISATSSPHLTVERDAFSELPRIPVLLLDLAVPRDIDPEIGAFPGVTLVDIDTLAGEQVREDHSRQLEEIDGIIAKYSRRYLSWRIRYEELVEA